MISTRASRSPSDFINAFQVAWISAAPRTMAKTQPVISFGFQPGVLGKPGPFGEVGGDIGRELGRRAELRVGAELGKLLCDLGRADGAVGRIVQLADERGRRAGRQEDAVGDRALVTR